MLASHKTKYSADSIEKAPRCTGVFACATYQLDSDTRQGNVSVLQYQEDSISVLSCTETGGVLDLWWKDDSVVLAACASGQLCALRVDTEWCLEEGEVADVSDKILLAVDGSKERVVTSDTGGVLYTLEPDTLEVVTKLEGLHGAQGWGAEVWGLALDKHDPNITYTGGDDCLLRAHDLRSETTVATSRYHTMGVCCISPDPTTPHNILSGSYDETIVHWDTRNFKQPLRSVSVGGGVWRIKRDTTNSSALIAGMHSGFHVVDLEDFSLKRSYTEHESLAYGADFLDTSTAATCSFYDNLVTVWSV